MELGPAGWQGRQQESGGVCGATTFNFNPFPACFPWDQLTVPAAVITVVWNAAEDS